MRIYGSLVFTGYFDVTFFCSIAVVQVTHASILFEKSQIDGLIFILSFVLNLTSDTAFLLSYIYNSIPSSTGSILSAP
jgi:hypothetical protein